MSASLPILQFFKALQQALIRDLRQLDATATEQTDRWERPGGGGGLTHVFADGTLIEKGGINFSHVMGKSLPDSATRSRPELANQPFEAMGVSVVFHPRNPFVPTTHMNVRHFSTRPEGEAAPKWWFGGGFDLTPYYPFEEDAISWHTAARQACQPFGADLYPRFKAACDRYFYLPHRNETRGIGGLFFDDFDALGRDGSFALTRSIGEAFFPAWATIAAKRAATAYGESHRAFQAYRRGRYVEFNLLYDRGTLFGLQSKGRTESILMSLPPRADWAYAFTPGPGSPEAALQAYLQPREWLPPSPSPHE